MQRQSWPAAWLLTDERMGDGAADAIRRAVAVGAGVIIRHHCSPPHVRESLAQIVRASNGILGVSGDPAFARGVAADLLHAPRGDLAALDLPFSLSVHDEIEARLAARSMAALVFVSPLYPTRSHPGAPSLGEEQALRLARLAGKPAVALGGIDRTMGERLLKDGWEGWAGIDAWL